MATQVQDLKHLAGAKFLVPFLIALALVIALSISTLAGAAF